MKQLVLLFLIGCAASDQQRHNGAESSVNAVSNDLHSDMAPTSHEHNLDYFGKDIDIKAGIDSWQECAEQCSVYPRCTHWTYHDATTPFYKIRNACFLKTSEGTRKPCSYCVSGKLTDPKLFVSDINVAVQMLTGAPDGYIDLDINDGLHSLFHNWYAYIGPIFTAIDTEAATSFRLLIQDNSISGLKDLADGMGGKYRYLEKVSEPNKQKIISIHLTDSNTNTGFDGCTENINEGRGGKDLFLCWYAEKVPPKRKCCLALTAQCLACQAGLSVEVFCKDKPMTKGCPKEKYYVDNGCQSEQEFGETNLAGTFQPKFFKAGVLCCDTTGYRCAAGNTKTCSKNKEYFDEAVSQCQNAGMRLCTRDELLSNICCKAGSSCHSNPVWTSTKEPENSGLGFYGCSTSKIALKDPRGRYVVALPNDEVACNGTTITKEAIFTLVDQGGAQDTKSRRKIETRTIGLKSVNGRWLVAYPTSDNITFHVAADGYNKFIGRYQIFKVRHNDQNQFWFQTPVNNYQKRYLIGRPDGTLSGNATRHDLRRWAKFTLECMTQPRIENAEPGMQIMAVKSVNPNNDSAGREKDFASNYLNNGRDSSRGFQETRGIARYVQCEGDLIFDECHSACPPVCGEPDDIICPLVCNRGCECPRGYYRAFRNSPTCVRKEDCKVEDVVPNTFQEEIPRICQGNSDCPLNQGCVNGTCILGACYKRGEKCIQGTKNPNCCGTMLCGDDPSNPYPNSFGREGICTDEDLTTLVINQTLWSPNTESIIKYLISDATLGIKFLADLEVQGMTDETLRVKMNNPQFIFKNTTVSLTEAAPILEKSGLAVGNDNHNMHAFIRHMKTPMVVQFKKGRARAIITMDGEPSSVTEIKKNLALQLEKNKSNSHLQLKKKQQIVRILQTPMAPKIVKLTKTNKGLHDEFGVPFLEDKCGHNSKMWYKTFCLDHWSKLCTADSRSSYDNAISKVRSMNPIDTIYLDFDKTMTVNDYSTAVRNSLCQNKYPSEAMTPNEACPTFDANDAMLMVKEIKGNDTATMILEQSMAQNIRNLLIGLRDKNITVKIVSTSWYPITENQWHEYLFYVSKTLGLGFSREEILPLYDPGPGLSADKGQKIRADLGVNQGRVETVMFADDSKSNIISSLDVCNSLYIIKRTGLKEDDMSFIKASTKKFENL